MERLQKREQELSETAAVDIGHNNKLWLKWLDLIHKKYEDSDNDNQQDKPGTTARKAE
jgi:hypothetical protein